MSTDPRAALNALVTALERHLEMASDRRRKDDPAMIAAYQRIANAFVDYDDALLDAYGEVTPLDVYSDDGEDDDYDEDDLEAVDPDGVDIDSLDTGDGQGDDDSDDDSDDDGSVINGSNGPPAS